MKEVRSHMYKLRNGPPTPLQPTAIQRPNDKESLLMIPPIEYRPILPRYRLHTRPVLRGPRARLLRSLRKLLHQTRHRSLQLPNRPLLYIPHLGTLQIPCPHRPHLLPLRRQFLSHRS